jgi:hypothetical protein
LEPVCIGAPARIGFVCGADCEGTWVVTFDECKERSGIIYRYFAKTGGIFNQLGVCVLGSLLTNIRKWCD